MFLFKKIVSQFFFPMPACLFFCFTGLGLLWWTGKQKAGKIALTIGVLALAALSCAPVADALLSPLEQTFPPYARGGSPPAKYVVVLGGGHDSDSTVPFSSQLSDQSMQRLVEGIRIYRENPGSKLIVSGGSYFDEVPTCVILANVAKQLGVNGDDVVMESESKDTEDEARLIAPIVATNRFVLVTSASHLPRSMRLFHRAGLKPQPAPAGHLVKNGGRGPERFFPNTRYLKRAETAFYEGMGQVWLSLTAKWSSGKT